jgi:hypothetical protein
MACELDVATGEVGPKRLRQNTCHHFVFFAGSGDPGSGDAGSGAGGYGGCPGGAPPTAGPAGGFGGGRFLGCQPC